MLDNKLMVCQHDQLTSLVASPYRWQGDIIRSVIRSLRLWDPKGGVCGPTFPYEAEEGPYTRGQDPQRHNRCETGEVYITAYSLFRYYGGPEEGGWYYTSRTPLETVTVPRGEGGAITSDPAMRVFNDLRRKWARDGRDVHVMIEPFPRQSETVGKPCYC